MGYSYGIGVVAYRGILWYYRGMGVARLWATLPGEARAPVG